MLLKKDDDERAALEALHIADREAAAKR